MGKVEEFVEAMGVKISDQKEKKGRFYFNVTNEDLREVVDYLFNTIGCRLSTATGMETFHHLEILYHFSDDTTGQYYCPRLLIADKEHPKVKSIAPIVTGAIWIEREIFEMLGVEFEDHPRMEKLLTLHHPKDLDKPLRMGRAS